MLIILGVGEDYDCETQDGPRCAIGELGDEVKDRWVCSDCNGSPCLVYVEHYDDRGQGSTRALCAGCCAARLAHKPRTTEGTT